MSRVRLFVQTGSERPHVWNRAVRRERWLGGCIGGYRGLRICQAPSYFVSKGTNEVLFSGGVRWWLVQCENADAGRRLILATLERGHKVEFVQPSGTVGGELVGKVVGRILASGGKP